MDEEIIEYGKEAATLPPEVTEPPTELPEEVTQAPTEKEKIVKIQVTLAPTTILAEASYDVPGESLDDVIYYLEKNVTNWGLTSCTTIWSCEPEPKTDFMSKMIIKPHYRLTLPKWPAYADQSKEDQQSWDKMVSDLKNIHEQGHITRYNKYIQKFVNRIKQLRNATAKDVEDAFEAFRKCHQCAQDKYDKDTNRGIDQIEVPKTTPKE